ncbi:MAG: NHL repeat-containing protein [Lachnospiraceae bacterium]|nr:NHL repeat-containing protein [Lachnospiraceae bacterium]
MKNRKKTVTIASLILSVMLMIGGISQGILASEIPYDTYNYDYRENIVHTPAAYVPDGSISGVTLGIGAFKTPQDMCFSPDGEAFIADTGNNRIVVLNSQMNKVVRVIDCFEAEGVEETFSSPYGVAISQNGLLYVADSQNNRVVVMEQDGTFVKFIQDPQSDILEENYVFVPLKVTVDYADRVYCIAKNMFEGIMVFETDDSFSGFFGTIEVKISAWEKFWRKLATKEERSNQQLYIPTEFTGLDIDQSGFVYATNIDSEGVQAVRRLNPAGQDVIKKGQNGNVGGDLVIPTGGDYPGASYIVDVVYRDKGIYSLLDSRRGRIFTYDHEGNLLYIFGGLGSQAGTFSVPVAIESLGDKILVLDSARAEILVFGETEYGSLINDAVALRYDGDETLAVEKWGRVLELDENNELANSGIGKAYLTAGENELAMKYLKLGMDRTYYSIAFKRYRNEILKENSGVVMTVIVVFVAAVAFWVSKKKKKDPYEGGMDDEKIFHQRKMAVSSSRTDSPG